LLVDGNDKLTSFSTPCSEAEELFFELNGNVPCWKLHRSSTTWTRFLTDYVIIGQEILLDYYDDSGILHVGDLIHRGEGEYFTDLFDSFIKTYREEGSNFRPFLNFDPWYLPVGQDAS
jgi:hypothetical protein